ncbi:MAG: hypothetical protein AVDCRST_MAG51-3335 [uncultured Ramlibacter sp.]|uniref:DUF3618 domain-containing protein n=1 Tax=uncultured Ramlibacter sp. TaxID=260755 RepID=A0A6J4QJJ1_9BURK|nr:MAG: hypothetical protein AVDCRST_MAG51-3335 [uncultured Ramlibacter sp.]
MADNSTQDDPAVIEQDIRRTQEDMSRTVDKIGDQLTPKKIVNALLDKADESGVDTQYLIEGARRNPMALGLIAAGAIWLVSDKDSKFPSMPSKGKKPQAGTRDQFDELDLAGSDVHHRDYVSHMSSFEIRDNEDDQSMQRRRDLHRANFLMCERNPDEDDHSFRQRLNGMTDAFRQKRQAWSDSASQKGSAGGAKVRQAGQTAQRAVSQAGSRAQDMYSSNPLVGGILAAAVGAALGSTVPITRTEQEKLGSIGGKARDMASQQKDQLTEQATQKKDQLLEKADEKLQQAQSQQGEQGQQPQQQTPEFAGGTQSSSDGPFIISERSL